MNIWPLLFAAATASSPWDLVPPLPLDAELNYDFGGSTSLSRKAVKLTVDHPGERGYIVSNYDAGNLPFNFELELDFRIEGTGNNLYGDGMALWLLKDTPHFGDMMGLDDKYTGAALVLDTYRNGRGGRAFPRLIVMKNDGTVPYDRDNDGKANEIDGCSLRGLHNNKRQDTSTIRVSYSGIYRKFVVEVNYRNKWEPCISTDLDLGNDISRIALSAQTGDLTDSHIIYKVAVTDYENETPPLVSKSMKLGNHKQEQKEKAEREYVPSKFRVAIGLLFSLVFKLLLLVIVVFSAFKAFIRFRTFRQARDDRRYKLS